MITLLGLSKILENLGVNKVNQEIKIEENEKNLKAKIEIVKNISDIQVI